MALLDFRSTPLNEEQDEVFERANRHARYWGDIRRSMDDLGDHIQRHVDRPAARRLWASFETWRYPAFLMALCGYVVVLASEWLVSREIYDVIIPGHPVIAFWVLVIAAALASYCITEGVPALAIGRTEEPAHRKLETKIERLYGHPRKGSSINWTLLLGVVLACAVEAIVYLVSRHRVELMRQDGELAAGVVPFQTWLPVMLFGFDLMLGIPAWLCVLATLEWLQRRRLTRRYNELRRLEIDVRGQALAMHHRTRREQGRSGGSGSNDPPVCPELRALLDAEADNAHGNNGSRAQTNSSRHAEDAPDEPIRPERNREDDLVDVLDETIAERNRSV